MFFDHCKCLEFVYSSQTGLGFSNNFNERFPFGPCIDFRTWEFAEKALHGAGALELRCDFDLKTADWKTGPEGILRQVDQEILDRMDKLAPEGWRMARGSLRVECSPDGVGFISVWLLPPEEKKEECP
jgi:hypothetical protein